MFFPGWGHASHERVRLPSDIELTLPQWCPAPPRFRSLRLHQRRKTKQISLYLNCGDISLPRYGVNTQTYNPWFNPGIIHALHDCVVEVVGIAFVLVLEFVKKVEEVERE